MFFPDYIQPMMLPGLVVYLRTGILPRTGATVCQVA